MSRKTRKIAHLRSWRDAVCVVRFFHAETGRPLLEARENSSVKANNERSRHDCHQQRLHRQDIPPRMNRAT